MSFELISYQYNQISTENIDLFGKLETIPTYFRNFANNIKDFVSHTLNNAVSGDNVNLPFKLSRLLDQNTYATLSKTEVFVPPGLNVQMVNYLETLDKAHDLIANPLIPLALKPTSKWFAQMLSNPTNLNTVRDVVSDIGIKITRQHLEDSKKIIKAAFKTDNSVDRAQYANVYRRNSDFKTAVSLINKLTVENSAIDRRAIRESVTMISDGVDTMIQQFDNGDPQYQLNGKTIRDMTNTLMFLAELVEFYAAISFNIQSASTAIRDTVAQLDKMAN